MWARIIALSLATLIAFIAGGERPVRAWQNRTTDHKAESGPMTAFEDILIIDTAKNVNRLSPTGECRYLVLPQRPFSVEHRFGISATANDGFGKIATNLGSGIERERVFQKLGCIDHSYLIGWGSTSILDHNVILDSLCNISYVASCYSGNINIGAQLALSGVLRASNQSFSGPPQKHTGTSHNSGENCQDKSECRNRVIRGPLPEGFFWLLVVIFFGCFGATVSIGVWCSRLNGRDRYVSRPKDTTENGQNHSKGG